MLTRRSKTQSWEAKETAIKKKITTKKSYVCGYLA